MLTIQATLKRVSPYVWAQLIIAIVKLAHGIFFLLLRVVGPVLSKNVFVAQYGFVPCLSFFSGANSFKVDIKLCPVVVHISIEISLSCMSLHKECRDKFAWCDIVRFCFLSDTRVKVGDTLRLAVRRAEEKGVQLHDDKHRD